MKDTGLVTATEFLRHPSMVGSAFPATGRMVRRMLAPVDWSTIEVAVEYGPGSGRFTFAMLERLRPDAKLIAIETGAEFVEKLRAATEDPRLIVVEGSAEDIGRHLVDCDLDHADLILSGLPFSTLVPDDAARIMRATAVALAPSGIFAAYQMRTAIRPLIERHFAALRHGYEWWNVPPCHLYWATTARPDTRVGSAPTRGG
ncbi:class I SAM-dependent methyltransferase [Sphingobium phenoxybenzoativorans]|uniref:class I SAM-dependent methyltransferase n=1 Tax=Sphingobium phenoxybenzoativorans TaxID=1592790 RepID=UPI0008721298|nr:methyltransferase domain-containing protein [Sphingobium phenoxybenzoativorans]